MKLFSRSGLQTGALLIEILVIIGLFAVLLPSLIGSFIVLRQDETHRASRVQALFLTREATEMLRSIREDNWEHLTTSGEFHPVLSGQSWSLSPGPEVLGTFTRSIVISDVFRSEDGQIVTSGGTLDPSTKQVTVTVSWDQPSPKSVETEFYLTRYLDNLILLDETEADFNLGEQFGTAVVNTAGGEIVLASGGDGNWCEPTDHIINTFGLDGNSKIVRATQERVFTGTTSTGNDFFEIGVSQDEVPQFSLLGQASGFDTQDVFVDDQYAYVAVQNAPQDVYIIRLSDNQVVGWFTPNQQSGSAKGVFVQGNIGYMTTGNRLFTFDLSSKIGSRNQLGAVLLQGGGQRVKVSGNYAYVATEGGNSKLRVIEVQNNGSTLTTRSTLNFPGHASTDLDINTTATRAFLVTSKDGGKKGVYIINIENKNGPLTVVSEYDADDLQPQGIRLVTENKLLLGGYGAQEYQVIDISDEQNPTQCGGLDVPGGIYGLEGVLFEDGRAFSFIVTRDTGAELKLIKGGSGGNFTRSGYFDSQIFDMGWPTAFNYMIADYTEPVQTDVYFQVAIAAAVDDSCVNADYQYVGPDGTPATYFQNEGAISLSAGETGYVNPGRCLRYRAYLDTLDDTSSPIFRQMRINYSP